LGIERSIKQKKNKTKQRMINEEISGDSKPGVLWSFSVSLLCAESIGEPEKVGERTVGDFGVAVPRWRTSILSLKKKTIKKFYWSNRSRY
jgi:hypothetical protein